MTSNVLHGEVQHLFLSYSTLHSKIQHERNIQIKNIKQSTTKYQFNK